MDDKNPLSGVAFGQEKTVADCLARATWELEQAAKLREAKKPVGYQHLIAGHERAARAYEELARSRGGAPARARIPGIAGWNMFAGGSHAAPGKHSYSLNLPGVGEYHVDPISSKFGKHAGYSLKFAATGAAPRGSHGGLWHDLGTHRSPAAAAAAARKHYAASY